MCEHYLLVLHLSLVHISAKEAAKAPVTCSFEGKTYVEGEKFHVDGQCLTCICQEGFNGLFLFLKIKSEGGG